MIKKYDKTFDEIFTLNNIFDSWRNFRKGKTKKKDVIEFDTGAYSKIYKLNQELMTGKYKHDTYEAFTVYDPKKREIHKAKVKDRIIHQLIYDKMYSYFANIFIKDSYSSQVGKGTHLALKQYKNFLNKCSKNKTKTTWVLKCDIKKCFHSIDQDTLICILKKYIVCPRILNILKIIIKSRPQGIPLGNLTSQLFINIYLHEFDVYIKYTLNQKFYIRYADDFIVINNSKEVLVELLQKIRYFLDHELSLQMPQNKVSIRTASSGLDFLGWINFFDYKILRRKTEKRMLKRVNKHNLPSYLGHIQHGNTHKLKQKTLLLTL
jgi:RNA-directed DNA polymerase